MKSPFLLIIICFLGIFAQCQPKRVFICGTTAMGSIPNRTPLYIQFSVEADHTIRVGDQLLKLDKDWTQHVEAFKKALLAEVKAYYKKYNELPQDIRGTFAKNHLMGTRGMYRDSVVEVKKEMGIQ
ncbi:MAG TPA: hypothetical protein DCS93_20375 [Microscillaceae bacterium]|nr:hypothetical protein [Microscillaceae bacterium]